MFAQPKEERYSKSVDEVGAFSLETCLNSESVMTFLF